MFEQLDRCTNLESKGVQDIKQWHNIPVYEMTREPKCDKRKPEKEGA